jgi:hypothetical protein
MGSRVAAPLGAAHAPLRQEAQSRKRWDLGLLRRSGLPMPRRRTLAAPILGFACSVIPPLRHPGCAEESNAGSRGTGSPELPTSGRRCGCFGMAPEPPRIAHPGCEAVTGAVRRGVNPRFLRDFWGLLGVRPGFGAPGMVIRGWGPQGAFERLFRDFFGLFPVVFQVFVILANASARVGTARAFLFLRRDTPRGPQWPRVVART